MRARTLSCLAVWSLIASGCGGGGEPRDQQAPAAPGSFAVLKSRPDLRPPRVSVDRAAERPQDRLILVSPRLENVRRDGKVQQQGAMALDERGRTVWWRPVADGEPVTDLRVQRFRGRPVLTWWQGAASKLGIGQGEGVIADRSYRTLATVRAGNGQTADLHEFLLTPRGTALITIYSRARRDLRPHGGGANAQVTEGIVQEIDVDTGRVLLEWHSLDHVDLAESVEKLPEDPKASWDYFHINSVVEDGEDHLLISARNTSSVYRIERESGKVDWRLGGKRSDFAMGEGTEFGLQHDARRIGPGVVQLFDNVGDGSDDAISKVKLLRVDTARRRATLVREVDQPDGMRAQTQGNAHPQPDGGLMAGWGSTGAFSSFDAAGRLQFDAHLPAEYDTYRAYRVEWEGVPGIPPAIHARRDSGQVTVAASWNGATEVDAWQLLAGPRPDALEPLGGPADWQGLETTLVRMTDAPYVAVAALDAAGERLATSRAARVGE